jgi:uncharacterized membrane protein YccF (DUF307 family)
MRLILNVVWLPFGGLWLALGYLLAALVCFVLIVTIPFGFAALRIADYALWPFGRTIIGIPLALANLKLIPVSLLPLGKEIVPAGQPQVAI